MITERLGRNITIRYVFALGLIASALTASFLMLKLLISKQETTAAIVNVSGRQRMLSQRIALFSRLMISEVDTKARQHYRDTLTRTVKLMEESHAGLIRGSLELGLPDSMSDIVRSMYFDQPNNVDTVVTEYIRHANSLLSSWAIADLAHSSLAYITREGPANVVAQLDGLVAQYQHEGESSVARMLSIGIGMWVVALLILAGEARYIFRPMVRRVKSQVRNLEQANRQIQQEKVEQARLYESLESAREQLAQSAKLSAIGQLAAGAAHEINNPIGFVLSNLTNLNLYIKDLVSLVEIYEKAEEQEKISAKVRKSIAAQKKKTDVQYIREDVPDLVEESTDGLRRVSFITKSLLAFSERGSETWAPCSIHRIIEDSITTTKLASNESVTVIREFGALPDIDGIAVQLQDALSGILLNASEAIVSTGTITIRTGFKPGEVWIEITDTGTGIEQKNIGKIFDPFFTTKPIGSKVGLGLTLAYSIIETHNGQIDVSSEISTGTSFRIALPVSHDSSLATD